MPETEDDWREIAEGFNQRWNFPNCFGAIDSKHVVITPPQAQDLPSTITNMISVLLY